jgi:hypothetical protein
MKFVSTILSATLIAASSTVAFAQGAGGDVNPNRFGRGTDANPTGTFANPKAGNSAVPPSERLQSRCPYGLDPYCKDDMNSSNVSGQWDNRGYRGAHRPKRH